MLAKSLLTQDLSNLELIERVSSLLSLLGICFIMATYAMSSDFHKPINRLVFYASAGNIFSNIATLMAREYVHVLGPVCQLQGFLIQMFLPADAYWTLAMAFNVWLTFYHKYDKNQLRALEKWYILLCYGIPLLPALAFFAVNDKDKGRIYGNATLWCWISNSWDGFRIGLFYGPVWFATTLTIGIYSRAGKDIWMKRNQLREFNANRSTQGDSIQTPRNPFGELECIQRTIDIVVNYEDAIPDDSKFSYQNPQHIRYPEPAKAVDTNASTFTVDISSKPTAPGFESAKSERTASVAVVATSPLETPLEGPSSRRYNAVEANTAIWAYTKVSLLFFLAMMITWIPSSANRVYSLVYPGEINLGLAYSSALVLPLQGFWNASIYAMTSLSAWRELWKNIKAGEPMKRSHVTTWSWFDPVKKLFRRRSAQSTEDREYHGAVKMPRGIIRRSSFADGDSMTELQPSQASTKESSFRA